MNVGVVDINRQQTKASEKQIEKNKSPPNLNLINPSNVALT